MPLPFAVAVKPEFLKTDIAVDENKSMNFYKIINILTSKKDLDELERVPQSSNTMFMINRIFSADRNLSKLAYAMSMRYDMPVESALLFYLYTIPMKKGYRTLYSNNKNKILEAQLGIIQSFFECNKMKAEEYLKILSPTDLEQIMNIMKKTKEYENEE
jgi:hypothetical protein